MCILKNFTILTLSVLVPIYATNACIETDNIFPCTCSLTEDKIKVDCSGYGLKSVPENLPERTAVLDFSDNLLQPHSVVSLCRYKYLEHVSIAGNHLTSIVPRSFQRCKIKESLNLTGNPLNFVDKYTFDGLEFTHELHGLEAREFKENTFTDMYGLNTFEMITHQYNIPASLFRNNRIMHLKISARGATEIPERLISPLNQTLVSFILTSPSIQTLPERLLLNLKTLKQCTIQVRELHSIRSTIFQDYKLYNTVETINLSGIKSLPRRVFWSLGRMRHLEIHGAIDLPSDLFYGLLGLESLDLTSSTVHAIPTEWFKDLWSLKTLTLHDVELHVLRKEDFKFLNSVQELDLSKNRLRSLDPELFHHISRSVKFINISENILKTVPRNIFKEHSVLECLDISKNHISAIENEAFYLLPELNRLHLQNNKLAEVDATTFVYNVNMTYLDMSSNVLTDLPGELFNSTHRLIVFNLSDNNINNLGRSIQFYVPTLREINLRYNPIECDCGTETVKKLLLNVSIIGDCEKPQWGIAIVDFIPESNCLSKSDSNPLITRFISSTDFLYPPESKIGEWESKLIISTNETVSTITHGSIPTTAAVASVNALYTRRALSASRLNNFTILNNHSSEIKFNEILITKQNVSESGTAVLNTLSFSTTPGYNKSVSDGRKLTSVAKNESQVYSSDSFWDFNVNKTQTEGENSKLIHFKTPVVSTPYKSDIVVSTTVKHEVSSASTYTLKTEPEVYEGKQYIKDSKLIDLTRKVFSVSYEDDINFSTTAKDEVSSATLYPLNTEPETTEGTSDHTIPPDVRLDPSFETTASVAPYSGKDISLSETIQTKSVVSEHVTLKSLDVESISPTRVYNIEPEDDKTMTDGFQNVNETIETGLDATALPPIAGYGNITGDPKMAGIDEESEYFFLSLASIVSVAVFSVLILVFLYYRRRRSSEHEVGSRRDINVYNVDDSFHEDDGITQKSSLCPLAVPSIQIESVDDEGNVKLEFYPTSDT